MCCPDSYSWSSFLSHVFYSFYNLILLSLACYILKYTYIYLIQSAKITLLFLFIYVAVFLWACNQKGNKKQCLKWLVHGGACLVLQAGSCPLSPMEILPWLSFRSSFLALLFFSLSFSYVLFSGTRFCFLLPERKLESSNNSSRKSPNLSSLKLPFPRKGSFAISNIV